MGISVLYFQTGDLLASLKCKSDEDDEKLLLAIAEARYGAQKPLVICSQYMRNGFCDLFRGKAGAEGIMDRLVHPSY